MKNKQIMLPKHVLLLADSCLPRVKTTNCKLKIKTCLLGGKKVYLHLCGWFLLPDMNSVLQLLQTLMCLL